MFQMLGVFAEFERSIVQERVRGGLRGAKTEGKQLGRPRIAPELEARILAALKAPGRADGVPKIEDRSRPIASSAPALSANGFRRRRSFLALRISTVVVIHIDNSCRFMLVNYLLRASRD